MNNHYDEAEAIMEDETKFHFHCACQAIVESANVPALNYAVNYAKAGLKMVDSYEIKVQALYILNNMTHWRGSEAKEVREILKGIK